MSLLFEVAFSKMNVKLQTNYHHFIIQSTFLTILEQVTFYLVIFIQLQVSTDGLEQHKCFIIYRIFFVILAQKIVYVAVFEAFSIKIKLLIQVNQLAYAKHQAGQLLIITILFFIILSIIFTLYFFEERQEINLMIVSILGPIFLLLSQGIETCIKHEGHISTGISYHLAKNGIQLFILNFSLYIIKNNNLSLDSLQILVIFSDLLPELMTGILLYGSKKQIQFILFSFDFRNVKPFNTTAISRFMQLGFVTMINRGNIFFLYFFYFVILNKVQSEELYQIQYMLFTIGYQLSCLLSHSLNQSICYVYEYNIKNKKILDKLQQLQGFSLIITLLVLVNIFQFGEIFEQWLFRHYLINDDIYQFRLSGLTAILFQPFQDIGLMRSIQQNKLMQPVIIETMVIILFISQCLILKTQNQIINPILMTVFSQTIKGLLYLVVYIFSFIIKEQKHKREYLEKKFDL